MNQKPQRRHPLGVRIVTRSAVAVQEKISEQTKSVKATVIRLASVTIRVRELPTGELVIEVEPP